MSSRPAAVSWSGGKDCTLALSRIRRNIDLTPVTLLTTIDEESSRVGLHGVPVHLLERQAAALGLPLERVPLPPTCPNAIYEERMGLAIERLADRGVAVCVYGDIALEDIRAYREKLLTGTPIQPTFPLWGTDPKTMVTEFQRDYRATVVAVDLSVLDRDAVGRHYDRTFLDALPADADPAGEGGEFHTFVHDGPVFAEPVEATFGRTVERSLEGTRYAYATVEDPTAGDG